jgi:hypothetical protein
LRRFICIAAVALCAASTMSVSADTGSSSSIEPEKNYVWAISNSQLSNLALFGFNRFITRAEYAMIDAASIRRNLTSSWVWDQDEFSVNQIGHPYQGSSYFVAGRANGLSFAESSLVALGGSAVWELFYETETPSRNDLVTTSLGGVALGEMLHRLYLEADRKDMPGAFLLSPMDAFNSLVTGKKSPHHGSALESGELSVEAGFLDTRKNLDQNRYPEGARDTVTGNVGLSIVYGDPFAHWTNTPYSHFEQHIAGVLSPDYYSLSFFSDGLLFGRVPFDDEKRRTTVGMSLHYDFIYNSDINFSANSVGVTFMHERRFAGDSRFSLKTHLNWMPLAATDSVLLRYGEGSKTDYTGERRDYDMGTGVSLKNDMALQFPRAGKFALSTFLYAMKTIPASVPEDGTGGTTLINVTNLSYERKIRDNLATGLSGSMYRKYARYSDAPAIDEMTNNLSVYIRYRVF